MVSTSDKTSLRTALDKSFEDFKTAFSAFSDDEVNKLFPGSGWSPVQVATHIIKGCDGVPDNEITKADRPYDAMLAQIRPWWTDMSKKFESPEFLVPGKEEHSKKEIENELQRIHAKDLHITDTKDLSELCKGMELPVMGYLTRYEWLYFIQMHLDRHSFQLRNMRNQ